MKKLKLKIKNAWLWTKDKARKFWRWLVGLLVVGTAIASFGGIPPSTAPNNAPSYQELQGLVEVWNYEIKKKGGKIDIDKDLLKDPILLVEEMNKFVRARPVEDEDGTKKGEEYAIYREDVMKKFEDYYGL